MLDQIKLNFVNEFDQAIKSDLILSLVDCSITNDLDKNGQFLNQSILCYNNIKGLKYISLAPINNASEIHYHFKYNSASFIESPLILTNINNKFKLKAYVSTWDKDFYESCLKLFNMLIEEKNLIFKGKLFGAPSDLVRAYKSSQLDETLRLAIEHLKLNKSNTNLEINKKLQQHDLNELVRSQIGDLFSQIS